MQRRKLGSLGIVFLVLYSIHDKILLPVCNYVLYSLLDTTTARISDMTHKMIPKLEGDGMYLSISCMIVNTPVSNIIVYNRACYFGGSSKTYLSSKFGI